LRALPLSLQLDGVLLLTVGEPASSSARLEVDQRRRSDPTAWLAEVEDHLLRAELTAERDRQARHAASLDRSLSLPSVCPQPATASS
jgi:hypothetical protein